MYKNFHTIGSFGKLLGDFNAKHIFSIICQSPKYMYNLSIPNYVWIYYLNMKQKIKTKPKPNFKALKGIFKSQPKTVLCVVTVNILYVTSSCLQYM